MKDLINDNGSLIAEDESNEAGGWNAESATAAPAASPSAALTEHGKLPHIPKELPKSWNDRQALRKALGEYLHQNRGARRVSTEDWQTANAAFARVSKALFDMQQGETAPEIDADVLAGMQIARRNSAVDRAGVLAALESLSQKPDGNFPISVAENLSPQMARILADPEVAAAVRVAAKSLAQYAAMYHQNFNAIHPSAHADHLRHRLYGSNDPAERSSISKELVTLDSPSAREAAIVSIARLLESFQPVDAAIRTALGLAKSAAEKLLSGDLELESRYFERAGLPRQETGVTQRWQPTIARITECLCPTAAVPMASQPRPVDPGSSLLTTVLGVSLPV